MNNSPTQFILLICCAALASCNAAKPAPQDAPPPPRPQILSWGDQGDGTYRNPILKSDYSDPDVIRVGDDFYLVASDFHFVGMQVLHSRDLVNWQIIGQVYHRLDMDPRYDQMNGYGQGTWAPSLRFHDGKFYIYVCTPYDGLFMFRATNPAGPWQEFCVLRVQRWEDPCPLWDDDGQAYLVHSFKGAGPLILHRMSSDGTQLLDDGREIYRNRGAEGPKLYKRHGYYYISLPEGGVGTGWQTVLRSKNIFGPYEKRQVLPPFSPHQGGIVELASGESWFIGFKSTGFLGRIDYLEPVTWGSDDWPTFGDNGEPVQQWKKPNVGLDTSPQHSNTSDDFTSPNLSPIWQWNHNPVNDNWSLTARPDWLRLTALPAPDLAHARNTLTQKIWDDTGQADIKLDVSNLRDGDLAGITFISGDDFAYLAVSHSAGQRKIQAPNFDGPSLTSNEIYFRALYTGSTGHLQYSFDGQSFADIGQSFPLRYKFWKGARLGIFCYGTSSGYADFKYFHYTYGASPPR